MALRRQGRQFESGRPDLKSSEDPGLFSVMCYFVYIIFSRSCDKFYTGHTQDLVNRITEHNNGEGNFTSRCFPWNLVWSTSVPSRGEAMALENKIKKRGAKRFLDDNLISFDRNSRGA